jgi:hypothetical protein
MAREKDRNRLKCGKRGFTPLPRVLIYSQSFARLSAHAVKLFFDLMAQYKGFNNGDLSAAWKLMHARGWRSRDTLGKALAELQERGFIVKTRQGGLHKCSLFALTPYEVDECLDKSGRSKFDAHMKPTKTPPDGWYRESLPASSRLIPQKGEAQQMANR